jgi:hypothetical protein
MSERDEAAASLRRTLRFNANGRDAQHTVLSAKIVADMRLKLIVDV